MEAIKRCTKCGSDKPLSAYSLHKSSAYGRHSVCKACACAYAREWKHRRPFRARRVLEKRAYRHSLTVDRLCEMLCQTKCEACGQSLDNNSDKRVDHRHADGAVRGILCDRCNRSLGLCDENPAVLLGICDYIARTMNVDYRKQPYAVTSLGVSGTLNPIDSPTPEADGTQCPTNLPQKLSSPQA